MALRGRHVLAFDHVYNEDRGPLELLSLPPPSLDRYLPGVIFSLPLPLQQNLNQYYPLASNDGAVLGLQALHNDMELYPADLPACRHGRFDDCHQNTHHDHPNYRQ